MKLKFKPRSVSLQPKFLISLFFSTSARHSLSICVVFDLYFYSHVNFKLSLLNAREAGSRAYIDRTTENKAPWILTLFLYSVIYSFTELSIKHLMLCQKWYHSRDKKDSLCLEGISEIIPFLILRIPFLIWTCTKPRFTLS